MERIIKIEATGSSLIGFIGYVKEKDAEKTLTRLKNNHLQLQRRHSELGFMKVTTSVYNPELPYSF